MLKPPPTARGPVLPPRPDPQGWQTVLYECGYPECCMVLDAETYFSDSYHMGKGGLSTIEYIMDPRFECLGWAVGGPSGASWAHPDLITAKIEWDQTTVIMQNARFDASILAYRYGIYPKYIVDTLALARHWNSRQKHGLEHLAKQHGLEPKGDTKQFSGVNGANMTPLQAKALADYATHDAELEWTLFTRLLPKLSNPAIELKLIQHTIELFTRPTLQVDFAKGEELVKVFNGEVAGKLAVAETPIEEISGNKSFERLITSALTGGGYDPAPYFKHMKLGPMLAIADGDPQREQLLTHPDPWVRELMEARLAVKSWPLHVGRVKQIMAQAKANAGNMAVPLRYCGAHTGRYSGDEGINLCNLPKLGVLARMRELLIAPPGHSLVIVDASQIEARGTDWIAGQQDYLDKWASGQEIYCEFASRVLGYNVRKPRKDGGIKAIESRMAWARNAIGKVGILGCGYGMGPPKAVGYAGGAIDLATAKTIVAEYRASHKSVVKFWYDVEGAFRHTAKYRKCCGLARGLRFDASDDCDVIITLPNGRELFYHKVRVVDDGRNGTIEIWNDLKQSWEHTWGGGLTENIVQAFCRDILVEAMLSLEDAGIHTAHHVYDELVIVAPEDQAEATLDLAIQALAHSPTWAPGLPLAAEGHVAQHYGKQ